MDKSLADTYLLTDKDKIQVCKIINGITGIQSIICLNIAFSLLKWINSNSFLFFATEKNSIPLVLRKFHVQLLFFLFFKGHIMYIIE